MSGHLEYTYFAYLYISVNFYLNLFICMNFVINVWKHLTKIVVSKASYESVPHLKSLASFLTLKMSSCIFAEQIIGNYMSNRFVI